MKYNKKGEGALTKSKPNYKVICLLLNLGLSYVEASLSFPPFFSCSFSFFFLFSWVTSVASSVSAFMTFVGTSGSFSLSLADVAEGVMVG